MARTQDEHNKLKDTEFLAFLGSSHRALTTLTCGVIRRCHGVNRQPKLMKCVQAHFTLKKWSSKYETSLQQESRRRDQQSYFSKGPSRCLRPPLHMRLFARPGCPVTKYIAIKKARNRTQLSCSVSRNSQALAKKEAYFKKAAKRSKPTSSKLTHLLLCKEFASLLRPSSSTSEGP